VPVVGDDEQFGKSQLVNPEMRDVIEFAVLFGACKAKLVLGLLLEQLLADLVLF
jgi:hypothetical protein